MSRRNLLICFDAFGTLFTPKRAVHLQYEEVARSLGMGPFREESVKSSFKEGLYFSLFIARIQAALRSEHSTLADFERI